MKLIKLNTDHYVVVADSEIKEGDWCEDNGTIFNIKDKNHLLAVLNCGSPVKITHSTQPLEWFGGEIIFLSEVKELLGVVDVDKKAFGLYGGGENNVTIDAFIDGYHQALEDNKAKRYTEEDMRKAIAMGYDWCHQKDIPNDWMINNFIQSLQPKTEWEVEFIDGKLKLK